MIMKDDPKHVATIILGPVKPEKEDEGKLDEGIIAAAKEILAALEKKDAKALAESLLQFQEFCEYSKDSKEDPEDAEAEVDSEEDQ